MNLLKFLSVAASVSAISIASVAAPGDAADKAQIAQGKKLFASVAPACAICHTLADAGAEGEVGRKLDELKPDAGRVAKATKNGLGNMPPYGERLSSDKVAALARYISFATGAAK